MKKCLNQKCKKSFKPKRERAKFCSDLCRATHHQDVKYAKKRVASITAALDEVELIEKGKRAGKLFDELIKELGNDKIKSSKK